jgi:hypothetical protein
MNEVLRLYLFELWDDMARKSYKKHLRKDQIDEEEFVRHYIFSHMKRYHQYKARDETDWESKMRSDPKWI